MKYMEPMNKYLISILLFHLFAVSIFSQRLNISGIYPNLVMYNHEGIENNFGEAGIGALVPWGEKLWGITYTCHALHGSTDKLYEIDENMEKIIRPESVGGTHANRMIHRESKQLIMGPYFIKEDGTVRLAKFPDGNYGRLTAVTRHLSNPREMVYFYDMEGIWYEANVYSLDVTRIHNKPVAGWHGKGAYVGQGRFIIANNGVNDAPSPYWKSPRRHPDVAKMLEEGYLAGYKNKDDPENAGGLAEYDGKNWNMIEARQYTDVCGPGGLYGNGNEADPVWAIGWDKRSLRLKVLDNGIWHTYHLPKASHCYEHESGIYTEWPRFREVGRGKWILDMFGMFFNWPQHFRSENTSDISPISSHLRVIPDFGHWKGKVFLGADDAAKVTNPMPPGLSQSNIWFGEYKDLEHFGPVYAWGGPWMQDEIKASQKSEPFLVNGFDQIMIHLQHNLGDSLSFIIETDTRGNNQWKRYKAIGISEKGYGYFVFPDDFKAEWIRISVTQDCSATAYFFLNRPYEYQAKLKQKFRSLAEIENDEDIHTGLVWPDQELGLQFIQQKIESDDMAGRMYQQVQYSLEKDDLVFSKSEPSSSRDIMDILPVANQGFEVDEASVIYTYNGNKYRLPKGDSSYSKRLPEGYLRSHREIQSERGLMNLHGTFYEIPRDRVGIPAIKPVASHNKRIKDYCSWRGLLVLSGTKTHAEADGNYFGSEEGGLWFGMIEDLWQLGKPVGKGGPLCNTPVIAGQASDPYLMTRYDKKTVQISHDLAERVTFSIEVDFTNRGTWALFKWIGVDPGESVLYSFPRGYHSHWVRIKTDKNCTATTLFYYD
jgi:hypothetical protein